MNAKTKGEKGERIAIGELAKLDIDVAIPMTDNLPWDFIIVYENKLFKAQVKSSSTTHKNSSGSIEFSLTSNNWNKGTVKKYDKNDCDIMILCDYENVYLLGPDDFSERRAFSIRKEASLNGQTKGINFHKDYVLSKKRIKDVLKQ